ncbi:MAG TPA: hypothetical protein VNT75_16170 [Symbiobacteriaceae bacterium]|nr:hypothetical protein [Symbiobacteriaceae bacterium]
MKMRILGFGVVLVALAFIVNALALSSAQVTNKLTIPVTTTDNALIAFKAPTSLDSDITLTATGANQMAITVQDGVQPNSTYIFDQVFRITNNSADNVVLGVTFPSTTGLTITLANSVGGATIAGMVLNAGSSIDVKMTVVADGTATSLTNGDLVISATKQ